MLDAPDASVGSDVFMAIPPVKKAGGIIEQTKRESDPDLAAVNPARRKASAY